MMIREKITFILLLQNSNSTMNALVQFIIIMKYQIRSNSHIESGLQQKKSYLFHKGHKIKRALKKKTNNSGKRFKVMVSFRKS